MTAALKPSEILAKAADLIEPEGAWTQGWWARTAVGQHVYPNHIDATCWCARGAMARVAGGMAAAEAAETFLSKAYLDGPIARFNDADGRTQAEVVAALRATSKLARSEGQ